MKRRSRRPVSHTNRQPPATARARAAAAAPESARRMRARLRRRRYGRSTAARSETKCSGHPLRVCARTRRADPDSRAAAITASSAPSLDGPRHLPCTGTCRLPRRRLTRRNAVPRTAGRRGRTRRPRPPRSSHRRERGAGPKAGRDRRVRPGAPALALFRPQFLPRSDLPVRRTTILA